MSTTDRLSIVYGNLVMINVPVVKFSKSGVWIKDPKGNTMLFFKNFLKIQCTILT